MKSSTVLSAVLHSKVSCFLLNILAVARAFRTLLWPAIRLVRLVLLLWEGLVGRSVHPAHGCWSLVPCRLSKRAPWLSVQATSGAGGTKRTRGRCRRLICGIHGIRGSGGTQRTPVFALVETATRIANGSVAPRPGRHRHRHWHRHRHRHRHGKCLHRRLRGCHIRLVGLLWELRHWRLARGLDGRAGIGWTAVELHWQSVPARVSWHCRLDRWGKPLSRELLRDNFDVAEVVQVVTDGAVSWHLLHLRLHGHGLFLRQRHGKGLPRLLGPPWLLHRHGQRLPRLRGAAAAT